MKNKNITIATLASFFGSFSAQFVSFGVGLIILDKTSSALIFGLSQFLGPLLMLALSPVTERLLRHKSMKFLIYSSQLLSMLVLVSLAFLFGEMKISSSVIMIVIILLSINSYFSQVFAVAYEANLKLLVLPEEIGKLKSYEETAGSIALIGSPIIAALVFNLLPAYLFVLLGVSVDIIAFFVISRLSFQKVQNQENSGKNKTKIRLNHSQIRLITGTSVLGFFMMSINIGLPYLQIDMFNLTVGSYAFTKICWSVGMLLAGFLSIKINDKLSMKSLRLSLVLLSLVTVIFAILLHLSKNHFFLIGTISAFSVLFAFILVFYRVSLSSYILASFDGVKLSNMLNRQKVFEQIFRAVGVVVFGLLYDGLEIPVILLLTGLGIAVSLLFFENKISDFEEITT